LLFINSYLKIIFGHNTTLDKYLNRDTAYATYICKLIMNHRVLITLCILSERAIYCGHA